MANTETLATRNLRARNVLATADTCCAGAAPTGGRIVRSAWAIEAIIAETMTEATEIGNERIEATFQAKQLELAGETELARAFRAHADSLRDKQGALLSIISDLHCTLLSDTEYARACE